MAGPISHLYASSMISLPSSPASNWIPSRLQCPDANRVRKWQRYKLAPTGSDGRTHRRKKYNPPAA